MINIDEYRIPLFQVKLGETIYQSFINYQCQLYNIKLLSPTLVADQELSFFDDVIDQDVNAPIKQLF